MKFKLYRVHLDHPRYGWEEIVNSKNKRMAIKTACTNRSADQTVGAVVEELPHDYLAKKLIVDRLTKEKNAQVDKLAKDYQFGLIAVLDEYKIKINNAWSI